MTRASAAAEEFLVREPIDSDRLAAECAEIAEARYGMPVTVSVTRRHSFTMAEVLPRDTARVRWLPSARPVTGIGTNPHASLESLLRKLQNG